jgi:hypothetical protein
MKVAKIKKESLIMLKTMKEHVDDSDYFIDETIRVETSWYSNSTKEM